jgi:hypothetical protein
MAKWETKIKLKFVYIIKMPNRHTLFLEPNKNLNHTLVLQQLNHISISLDSLRKFTIERKDERWWESKRRSIPFFQKKLKDRVMELLSINP